MEPNTTAWMMSALIAGVLGNRADSLLCEGVNALYERITDRLRKPAAHQVQRAIRKSYLSALILAVQQAQSKQSTWSVSSTKDELNTLLKYLKEKIEALNRDETYLALQPIDAEYREILFPKEGTDNDRKAELIANLKASIIQELERRHRRVPTVVKTMITKGWAEGNKTVDFYELTAAFFMQELKNNDQLSTFIQTEYLDHLYSDTLVIKIHVSALTAQLEPLLSDYAQLLPKVDRLLSGQQDLREGQALILSEIKDLGKELGRCFDLDQVACAPNIRASTRFQELECALAATQQAVVLAQREEADCRAELDESTEVNRERKQRLLTSARERVLAASQQVSQTKKSLAEFIKDILELARTISDISPSSLQGNTRLRTAVAYFEAGDFERAQETLDPRDIYADLDTAKRTTSEELGLLARITAAERRDGWLELACKYFRDAWESFQSYESAFAYAHFLHEQHRYSEALRIYQCALDLATTDPKRVATLNNLGAIHHSRGEYDEAYAAYKRALAMRRALNEIDPIAHQEGVAKGLNNLGLLLRDRGDRNGAEAAYREALDIRRSLADADSNIYLLGVATTLNNLGTLLCDREDYTSAEDAYREALAAYRATTNPDSYLAEISETLNNIGILYFKIDDYSGAEIVYKEAIENRLRLAKSSPAEHMPELANLQSNLSNTLRRRGDFAAAKSACFEALGIYRSLITFEQEAYLPKFAMTLNNLANVLSAGGKFFEAEITYRESLEFYRTLTAIEPMVHSAAMASILNNFGALLLDLQDFDGAERVHQEALSIRRFLVQADPAVYDNDVAESLNNLATVYCKQENFSNAVVLYQECVRIHRARAVNTSTASSTGLALALNNLGAALRECGDRDTAEVNLLEAFQIRKNLYLSDTNAFALDYATSHIALGWLYSDFADRQFLSRNHLSQAIGLLSPLVEIDPRAASLHNFATRVTLALIDMDDQS